MLAIGGTFDRYRIEEELGAGGMGRVYRAFDTKLHRRVALKVLASGHAYDPGGEATARMLREARAAAAFPTRAVAVLPRSVPAKLALADSLALLGREAEARDAYRSVLSLWQEQGKEGPLAERLQAVASALEKGEIPVRSPASATAAVPSSGRSPSESVPRSPAPRAPAVRAPAPRTPSAKPSPDNDIGL